MIEGWIKPCCIGPLLRNLTSMMGDHYDSIPPSGQRGSVACASDSAGRRSVTYAKQCTSDLRQVCVRMRGKVWSPCRCLNSERNLGDKSWTITCKYCSPWALPVPCPSSHGSGLGVTRGALLHQPTLHHSTGSPEIVEQLGGVRACRVPNINQVSCQQGHRAK